MLLAEEGLKAASNSVGVKYISDLAKATTSIKFMMCKVEFRARDMRAQCSVRSEFLEHDGESLEMESGTPLSSLNATVKSVAQQ